MKMYDYLAEAQRTNSTVQVYLFAEEEMEYGTVTYLGDDIVILQYSEDDTLLGNSPQQMEVAIRIKKIERVKKWL